MFFFGIYIILACECLGMGLANTLSFNSLLVLVTKFRFQLANQIWKLRRPGKQGWCEARKLQVVLEQGSYCLDHIKWKGVLYYYQSIPKPSEVLGHQRAWYLVIWHDDVHLVDIRMFWNIIQGWFVIWWADLMLQSIDEVWSWKDLVILHLLSLISLSVCMAVTGVSLNGIICNGSIWYGLEWHVEMLYMQTRPCTIPQSFSATLICSASFSFSSSSSDSLSPHSWPRTLKVTSSVASGGDAENQQDFGHWDGDQRCIRPGNLPRLLMLVLFLIFRNIIVLLTIDNIVFAEFAVVAILPRMFLERMDWNNAWTVLKPINKICACNMPNFIGTSGMKVWWDWNGMQSKTTGNCHSHGPSYLMQKGSSKAFHCQAFRKPPQRTWCTTW